MKKDIALKICCLMACDMLLEGAEETRVRINQYNDPFISFGMEFLLDFKPEDRMIVWSKLPESSDRIELVRDVLRFRSFKLGDPACLSEKEIRKFSNDRDWTRKVFDRVPAATRQRLHKALCSDGNGYTRINRNLSRKSFKLSGFSLCVSVYTDISDASYGYHLSLYHGEDGQALIFDWVGLPSILSLCGTDLVRIGEGTSLKGNLEFLKSEEDWFADWIEKNADIIEGWISESELSNDAMNGDKKIEKMIQEGRALDALTWLKAEPERRRIGEPVSTHPNFSIDSVASDVRRGFVRGVWICDIEKDAKGNEYATAEIFELPVDKVKRKVTLYELAIRFVFSEISPLVDVGQKYVLCPLPSAARLNEVHKMLRDG
jgi:hypothetical protein